MNWKCNLSNWEGGLEGSAFTLLKGGSAFCGQNAFRGRGGVKKGPKTAVILNVWPLKLESHSIVAFDHDETCHLPLILSFFLHTL